MAQMISDSVLVEAFAARHGALGRVKQATLVAGGVLALALAAKISVPMVPVPMTLGTFAVLSIGAAYGARLGLVTILSYMLVGALGFDVFAKSSADLHGLSYMMGSTGGYLLGFVLATVALGYAARRGWDRSPLKMALTMLGGNALIYVPGLLWLGVLYGFDKPILAWGLAPFVLGDMVKLALAAVLFPALWKVARRARS